MSDTQRTDLTATVEQLAWSAAREMRDHDPDPRHMWLADLTSLLAIRDAAEQLAASAALSAAQHGADYPEIGEAAGMTRQGARRKWPGLAGLGDERQRKLAWWASHREQFAQSVRAVLATAQESPRLAVLRSRLDDIEQAVPALDSLDMALVDAHTVAVSTPAPADPTAEHASGLLAALTADAYAAMNNPSPATRTDLACASGGCVLEPIVELWRPDSDQPAVPFCREHAVQALGRLGTRIVAAYRPDLAPSVFAEGGNRT